MTIKLDVVREQGEVTVLGKNEAMKRVLAKSTRKRKAKDTGPAFPEIETLPFNFSAWEDPFRDAAPCWIQSPEDFEELMGALCEAI